MSLYPGPCGHFSDDGTEYVVQTPHTPAPWINVIGNGRWGLCLSNAGGGYAWLDDANLCRITRFEQDLVRDAAGRWVYVVDADSGAIWSPAFRPAGQGAAQRCVHGLGYTRFEGAHGDIAAELTVSVPPDAAGEVWILRLENRGARPARLQVATAFEWQLGPEPEGNREFHKVFIESRLAGDRRIVAGKRLYPLPGAREPWNTDFPHAPYFAGSRAFCDVTDSKAAFVGRNGDWARPRLLAQPPGSARELGSWGDGLCATRTALELAPGATEELRFVLAVDEAAARWLERPGAELCAAVQAHWRERLAPSQVETPDAHVDLLCNHWLRYQAIACRIEGRAAYYQSSGAYGFRDQLQDSLLFLHLDPVRTRARILDHAAHQHADGTVLHWWHELSGTGLPSAYSDDLLWLPFVVHAYVQETDDLALLAEPVPFLDAAPDTIDAHCRRAIDRALARRSPRGLPLIGEGDWNDGLSSCGDEGRGESVWLAHFVCRVLADYAELLAARGDATQAAAYRAEREALCAALNAHGWDGAWYWRATLDDGTVIGSARCAEGRRFLNAQTWSLLADTVPDERRAAVIAAIRALDGEHGPLLLAPAYARPDSRIGYITRYAPGLRENGGVYTHAACWAIIAAARLGDGDWAYAMYEKLCPPLRGQDPERYGVEPYVTPGNVDGPDSPRHGRGGWTWYTGSAAWLYRALTEWILGVRPTREGLVVRPALPARWPGFRARRRFRGRDYAIEVTRGEPALELNGVALTPGAAFVGDEAENTVRVRVP